MAQIIIQNQGSDNLEHFNSCSIHCEQIEGTNNFKYFVTFEKYNGIDIIFTTPNNSLVPLNQGDVFSFEIVTQAQETFGSNFLPPTLPYFIGVFNMDSLLASPEDLINIYFYEFPYNFQVGEVAYQVTPNNYSENDQPIIRKKKQIIKYASMSSAAPQIPTKPGANGRSIKEGNSLIINKNDAKVTKNKISGNNKISGKK